jgi:hypothetical protein
MAQRQDKKHTEITETTEEPLLSQVLEETQRRSVYDDPTTLFPEIERLGNWLTKSGMFGVKNVEQGYLVAFTCFEEKITPFEFVRRYHIIENRPAKRADRMHADFLVRGGRVNWVEFTDEVCEAMFLHEKLCPAGVTIRVTFKEMHDRGITMGWDSKKNAAKMKANWKNWPRQMLKARVLSEGIRQVDPGGIAGEYTPEEISDMDGGHVTPDDTPTKAPESPQEAPAAEPPQDAAEPETPDDGASDHQKRVQKVLDTFQREFGLLEPELEAYAGDLKTGEVIRSEDWDDKVFKKFQKVRGDLMKAGAGAERKAMTCKLFNLPSSALEPEE